MTEMKHAISNWFKSTHRQVYIQRIWRLKNCQDYIIGSNVDIALNGLLQKVNVTLSNCKTKRKIPSSVKSLLLTTISF